jgi:MoaA/NifB/PqqE/SkfB family radical SAM enzyme
MVRASPHRTEEVRITEAMGWLEKIASYGGGSIDAVGFTGGEPFLCLSKLLALAHFARGLGLTYTVVTNAFWAGSRQAAYDILAELHPTDLGVSTDVYHREGVPIGNIRNAYEACTDLRIRFEVALAYDPESLSETRSLISELLEFTSLEQVRVSRVYPSGRAEGQAGFSDGNAACRPPSDVPCLFAAVPYILPNGDVLPCPGPIINLPRRDNPLYLGSLRETSVAEILDRCQTNPVLHGLRMWGPRFLHQLVEVHGPKSSLPKAYHTDAPCEGCMTLLGDPDVRSFLNEARRSDSLTRFVTRARSAELHETTGH